MIDFRIETFLCVCKHMNYTKAASELNITQPAVSQHIRFIEDYYGTKLFEYDKKILSLTPAGVELRNAMMSIHHDTLQLKKTLHDYSAKTQSFYFGATMSIGDFYLPPYLQAYMKQYPEVSLNMKIANTKELLDMLNDGIIDFAFVEGNFPKNEYDCLPVCPVRFIGIAGPSYPCDEIHSFSDLLHHPLLVREDGSGSKKILIDCLGTHGYTLSDFKTIHTFSSPHILKQFLMQNLGISFMYETIVHNELQQGLVKELQLIDFSLSHEFNFIWRKNSIYSSLYTKFFHNLTQNAAPALPT